MHCRDKSIRRFRTVPIGQKAVFIDLAVQRVECTKCQVVRQVKVPFVDKHKRFYRIKRFSSKSLIDLIEEKFPRLA